MPIESPEGYMRYVILKAGAQGIQLPNGNVYDAEAGTGITSSTNATPIAVTKAGHGLATGDKVYVSGHVTNTAANGLWTVTVSSSSVFTLDDSVGNGVGGATGTFRTDVIALTDAQYAALSGTAIDGDPVIDLGPAPEIDGDEVTEQGAAATTTATAPAALTYVAPAALTATAAAGAAPDAAEFDALLVDVTAIRTALVALGVDVTAVRTRQATIITELVGLDAAVSGSGKAVAT